MLIDKYVLRPGCCAVNTSDNNTVVTGPCYYCKNRQEVTVKSAAFEKFISGSLVQDCFPELSAGRREFLISGICDSCWAEMFAAHAERFGESE